jgi:polyhydroxyalkanoate synthesis regulator phasin
MAAPDRDPLEAAFLAALGAVSLTAERIEQLADSLAERGGIRRDEARTAIEDLVGRWRSEATRAGERAGAGLQGFLREAGLALRSEVEDLELRVAQLEHRVKLLERDEELALRPPEEH